LAWVNMGLDFVSGQYRPRLRLMPIWKCPYINLYILHFTFLFSLFVFVSAAGHYFRIWISHYLSIWTGQVPALLFLDKKYNIANSSCHFGSYGSIWTGPSPKKYYMDLRSFDPYNIFLVTNRSIYCHMTVSAMNYLLCFI
jgi:hypothetical protein